MENIKYKVGQLISVKNIPGLLSSHFKTKPPFNAEVVATNRDAKQPRVFVKIDKDIFNDPTQLGWDFFEGSSELEVVDGKSIKQRFLYLSPSCFDLVDVKGRPEATFKLNEEVKIEDQFHRVLGSNAKEATYIIEAADGEKLTHEMVEKMDIFVAYDVPSANGTTTIRCKIVHERDILKDKENKAKMKKEISVDPKESFVSKLKDDGADAAYRVGARQMSKAVQTAMVKMLQDKGYKKTQVTAIKEFLASELGDVFIKNVLGYALTYFPHLSQNERAQRMAKEFRVEGIAQIGNMAMEHLLPAMMQVFQHLPADIKEIEMPSVQKILIPEELIAKKVEVELVQTSTGRSAAV